MAIDSEDMPGFNWFKFYANDWLTDPDVMQMTSAERGIYIQLLAIQWRDNGVPSDCKLTAKLLGLDCRTTVRWWGKYGRLLGLPVSPCKLANPKLWKQTVASGKLGGSAKTESEPESDEKSDVEPEVDSVSQAGALVLQSGLAVTDSVFSSVPDHEISTVQNFNSDAEKLTDHLWVLLGKPKFKNQDSAKARWIEQAEKALSDKPIWSLQTHRNILDFAVQTDPFWSGVLREANSPMAMYASKRGKIGDKYDSAKDRGTPTVAVPVPVERKKKQPTDDVNADPITAKLQAAAKARNAAMKENQ
jgi:hypothetical protein